MTGYFEIAILLSLAAALGMFANLLKQPPLLGYIAAGVILNSLKVFPDHGESFELFGKIGITFLLFILGLELNLGDLKKLGKVAMVTGIGQILFTCLVGFYLSRIQGFDSLSSIYIAIALTFSSTVVIVKLLSSKNELHTLYGKISIGFLLVQDLAAMLILMGLVAFGSASGGNSLGIELGLVAIKAVGLVIVAIVFSKYIIPWIIKQTKHDREVLFITTIAWALAFAALVASPIFNFSIEIGALIAGIALSSTRESLQVESWTRSLRDFFLTVFFVLLGFEIQLEGFGDIILPTILFSIFVLIGNPLIVMIIMGFLGYNKRVSFFTSLAVAQISEFSLLVAALGLSMGHLEQRDLTIITLVGGITMAISSYFIFYNQQLYKILKPILGIFEFNKAHHGAHAGKQIKGHTVIFGFHRLGEDMLETIEKDKSKYLIVDHNPKVLEQLAINGVQVIYGDMLDSDIYDKLNMDKAKLVISTVPNKTANLTLLTYLERFEKRPPLILTAQNDLETNLFYEREADFVLYPHLLAGKQLESIITTEGEEFEEKLRKLSKGDKKILNNRFKLTLAP